MESRFKFKFRLDKRRKLDDNTYPIYVNIHTIKTNINLGFSLNSSSQKISCTENEFDSIWINRFKYNSFNEVVGETTVHGRKLEIRTKLKIAEDRLKAICHRKDVFTYKDVKKEFLNYVDSTPQFVDDVYKGFEEKIKDLKDNDQIKTAKSYQNTLNAIYRHNSGTGFRYSDVTLEWLKKYEKKRRKTVSVDSLAIDMRNLRHIVKKQQSRVQFYLEFIPLVRVKTNILFLAVLVKILVSAQRRFKKSLILKPMTCICRWAGITLFFPI